MGERVEGGDDEESKCPTGKCQQQEEGGQQKDDPMMDGTADAYDLEKPSNACDESMAKCQSRVGKFFEKKKLTKSWWSQWFGYNLHHNRCNYRYSNFYYLISLLMSFIESHLSNKPKQCILQIKHWNVVYCVTIILVVIIVKNLKKWKKLRSQCFG